MSERNGVKHVAGPWSVITAVKWRLAHWIIAHMPPHRVYVEPFSGAASVLLQKPPSKLEVLNDLNERLVNVFRVLRDPVQAARLVQLLRLTPCAESEYRACRTQADDPVEDARRMLVLGYQSHGSTGATLGKLTGWRRGDRGTVANSAREWANLWSHVSAWTDRLAMRQVRGHSGQKRPAPGVPVAKSGGGSDGKAK